MRASEPAGGGRSLVAAESPTPLLRGRPAPGWLSRIAGPAWPAAWDRRIVAALVVLAFGLRAPNLGRAYWIDEGITVGISGHPLHQIPSLLRFDGSPPLFYILLHGWMRVFGSSPVATHFLPLLFSLAVVPACWWAGRSLWGRTAGMIGAALAATNPFLNWYGTETRMYTLVCGLSVLAVAFSIRAVRRRRGADLVGAVVSFAALLYTHNWGIYLFGATTLVLLVRAWRDEDRALARSTVVGAASVAVLYAPWVPSFLVQARTTAAPWAVPPGVGDFFADPSTLLGGTLGIVVLPALALGAWWSRPRQAGRDGTGLALAVGVVALASGWVASYLEPSWTIRYLGAVFGPLVLAFAGALARSVRGVAAAAAVCTVCVGWSVIGSLLPNPAAPYAKSNVAAVAAAAAPDLHPGDVVVVAQTEQLAVLSHYLPAGLTYVTPTGPVSDPSYVDWRNLTRRLTSADVCDTVLPSIAALPAGADVLEIAPLRSVGTSGSAWHRAVRGKVDAISRDLALQPDLVATRSYAEDTSPRPFSGVVGELFVRQGGAITCP